MSPDLRAIRGNALLEVLVALLVLSTAGLATVELTQQALDSARRARDAETRLLDQDRLLAAYTLLNRRDLGERLGLRRVGSYAVRVDRLDLDLFRISVGLPDEAPELETVVYRPEVGSD